jgi:hypothetical protein
LTEYFYQGKLPVTRIVTPEAKSHAETVNDQLF